MKYRNKIIAGLIVLGFGISCSDESTYPIDFDLVNNSNAGILSQVVITSATFNINDIPNSTYDVTFEANDVERGKLFTKMELFVSFIDRTTAVGPDNSKDEIPFGTYQASEFTVDATTGLPRLRVMKTAPETMTALGLTGADIDGSDQFIYRQEMHFPDGRIYTNSNVNTAIASLGGVYKSPFANAVAVVCPSDLGGTVTYSSTILRIGQGGSGTGIPGACPEPVTGTTTFTQTASGVDYEIGDASFGFWSLPCNYYVASEGVTFSDSCGALAVGGSDQYGDTYSWSFVSNDGTTLVINWENTWGDSGQVSMTRTGGWPLNLSIP